MFEVRELKNLGLTLIADTADQWALYWLLEKASKSQQLGKKQQQELAEIAIKLRGVMDRRAGKEQMETGAEGEKLKFSKTQANEMEKALQVAIQDEQMPFTNRDKAVFYALKSAIDTADECKKTMGTQLIREPIDETA